MGSRLVFLGTAALLALVPACGSSGGDAQTSLLTGNRFEQELEGAYVLQDFTLFELGEGSSTPDDFESWSGELALNGDGTASITFDLCEAGSAEPRSCQRLYRWSADVAWIHLLALDSGVPNCEILWERRSGGVIYTEGQVPDNRADCAYLLVQAGHEHFLWEPAAD